MNRKEYKLDELMPLIREQLSMGHSVTFSPKGVSMLPMLIPGRDTVTLSPISGKLKKYDLPLYQRNNGQYVLHRIVGVSDTYTCIGDNQFHLEKGLNHDQMIAVVTAFTRNSHQYTVDRMSYRLYCRMWHFTRPIRFLWRKFKGLIKKLLKPCT